MQRWAQKGLSTPCHATKSVGFKFMQTLLVALERMWNRLYSKVPMSLIDSKWHGSKPRSFLDQNIMFYIEPT